MKKVLELEICSKPNNNLDEEIGNDLVRIACHELSIDSDIILGLSFLPDKTDVINLKRMLIEGDVSILQFNDYCEKHNKSVDANNAESAALFLEYEYGRALAWVHLPHDDGLESMLSKIQEWVNAHNCVLMDSFNCYCLI